MSDEILNGAAAESQAQPQGPSFTVEKLYVKDLSFRPRTRRRCSTNRASRTCR